MYKIIPIDPIHTSLSFLNDNILKIANFANITTRKLILNNLSFLFIFPKYTQTPVCVFVYLVLCHLITCAGLHINTTFRSRTKTVPS